MSIKNSMNDKLRKVRELDDAILSILEQGDAEQELKTVLSRDDRIQELILKIERCMNRYLKNQSNPLAPCLYQAHPYYRTTLK